MNDIVISQEAYDEFLELLDELPRFLPKLASLFDEELIWYLEPKFIDTEPEPYFFDGSE